MSYISIITIKFKGELKAICMLILKVQLDIEKYFAVKENV